MLTITAKPGATLALGREGENLARQIVFDVSAWQGRYGPGTVSLIAQRNGDAEPYPCAVTVDGVTVTWPITSADTARPDLGKCELQYRVDNVLVKSDVWRTFVADALGDAAETAPEPQKSWVDNVLEAGQNALDAAAHQPKIGEGGTWLVWDADTGAYIDTGVNATGPKGDTGAAGAQGAQGVPGRDGVSGADYDQNDPEGDGYIKNRPCYFTGAVSEEAVASDAAVAIGLTPAAYDGGTMEAGENYRLTINGVSVDLVASFVSFDGITGVTIGDSYADFYAGMTGQGEFIPTYGYLFGVMENSGSNLAALVPTDGTGAMLSAAFGLTDEQISAGQASVTLEKLIPQAVKLDKRLLPDDILSNYVVLDGNELGLSITGVIFSGSEQTASVPAGIISTLTQAYENKTPVYFTEKNADATTNYNVRMLPIMRDETDIVFCGVYLNVAVLMGAKPAQNKITLQELSLKGPQGPQGEQGPPGTDGMSGNDGYTPERGVDYWTAEDQQAIVDAVLAALPNGNEVAY